MEWIVIAAVGSVVGLMFSFGAQSTQMPLPLFVLLGTLGACVGGALNMVAGVSLFGVWSFYLYGVIVSIGFLAGGTLAFTLTSSERGT